jgi:hypothetical protein
MTSRISGPRRTGTSPATARVKDRATASPTEGEWAEAATWAEVAMAGIDARPEIACTSFTVHNVFDGSRQQLFAIATVCA